MTFEDSRTGPVVAYLSCSAVLDRLAVGSDERQMQGWRAEPGSEFRSKSRFGGIEEPTKNMHAQENKAPLHERTGAGSILLLHGKR